MKTLSAATTAISLSFLSMSAAHAGTCLQAPVASYIAGGFSCDAGNLRFSGFAVDAAADGDASISLNVISPVEVHISPGDGYFGLSLILHASAGSGIADATWSYHVTTVDGATLTGAGLYLASGFNASDIGTDIADERLSDDVRLQVTRPGDGVAARFRRISDVAGLDVWREQETIDGTAGPVQGGGMVNFFSTSEQLIPAPGSLTATLIGGLALLAVRRRRRPI